MTKATSKSLTIESKIKIFGVVLKLKIKRVDKK